MEESEVEDVEVEVVMVIKVRKWRRVLLRMVMKTRKSHAIGVF